MITVFLAWLAYILGLLCLCPREDNHGGPPWD